MDWMRAKSSESSDDFVRRYREPVYRLALSITGRADLAEDVAQETLLRGLKHRAKLDEPLTWLRVVAVRRAMSALKHASRTEPVPSRQAQEPTEGLAVRQTLTALPIEQQTLLALSIGEGWSYAEIAEALQIPAGTVASRIHAAKEAFRKKWGKNDES
jgi:RNA polymerase sigma-70 factor (ECF subfamily)